MDRWNLIEAGLLADLIRYTEETLPDISKKLAADVERAGSDDRITISISAEEANTVVDHLMDVQEKIYQIDGSADGEFDKLQLLSDQLNQVNWQ